MARVLYITYDGLLEPLGQSQVWQYVKRLAHDHRMVLLSFEKGPDFDDRVRMREMQARCRASHVHWVPLRYHKRPSALATAFDVAVGAIVAIWLTARHRLRIVHARSYVSSLMALPVKLLCRARYIFDMRGFWAEERIESGAWKAGAPMYRIAKFFEHRFILRSDAIVSLTNAAAPRIRLIAKAREKPVCVHVIPTCVDTELFRPHPAARKGFTLGYAGSIGGSYLFDDVMRAFVALRSIEPSTTFLVVTRQSADEVRAAAMKAGAPWDAIRVRSAEYEEMPDYLAQMDAGVFFYKPTSSRVATAPTRLAEFLAVGIPVWVNAGVGDVEEIVESAGQPVGVVMRSFSSEALEQSAVALVSLARDADVSARCRAAATKRFSIEQGVTQYTNLYQDLVGVGSGN